MVPAEQSAALLAELQAVCQRILASEGGHAAPSMIATANGSALASALEALRRQCLDNNQQIESIKRSLDGLRSVIAADSADNGKMLVELRRAVRTMIDALDGDRQQTAELVRAVESLRVGLAGFSANNRQQVSELRTTLQSLADAVGVVDHTVTTRLSEVRTEVVGAVETLSQQVGTTNSKVDAAVVTVEQKIDTLAQNVDTVVGALGQRVDSAVGTLGQKVDTAVGALGQRVDNAVGTLGQKVDMGLGAVGEKTDTALTAVGQRMDNAIGAMGQRVDSAVATAGARTDAAVAAAAASTDAAVGAVGNQVGVALAAMGEEITAALNGMADEIQNAFTGFGHQLGTSMSQQSEAFDALLEELKSQAPRERLNELEEMLTVALPQLSEEIRAGLQDTLTAVGRTFELAEREHGNRMTELHRDFASTARRLEASLQPRRRQEPVTP